MLTIITPVYCQSKKDHIYERIIFFIKNSYTTKKIKRIIIDFGSLESISSELVCLCQMYNIKYYNLNFKGNPFSAGECRNFGISKADTDYVTFQDVDLYAPNSTYEKIIQHLQDKTYYNDVECIPCLYLTEEFSHQYLLNENWNESHEIAYESYKGNESTIKMYAPVTSMILVRRQYLLESGGNNTEFHGHGYEDFELLNRIANRSNKFVRSRDFYNHDYKYDSADYCGYRTYFSLFGRELMNNKIFFVHIWHPENTAPSYSSRNKVNRAIFNKLLRKFDTELFMPPAISGVSEGYDGKTLILSPRHGKTANSIRVAIPYLGDCIFKGDKEFPDVNSFVDFLNKNSVKRVVFFNSYGNPQRLELYNICLEHKIKTINYDRGGLPDTWFFDSKGFNSASTSYSPEKWDIELDTKQTDNIQEYIQKILVTNQTLEKNGERIGSVNFSKKYNIENKKVIFVPLQRPNDSVIKYFSDSIESVDNFIHEIKNLAKKIKEKEWVIIIKQHPLEPTITFDDAENIILLNSNDHFCDAIIASNVVLLINSGVGLYSLMGDRPTYNVGNAYYSHNGLSNKISSPLDLEYHLDNLRKPNQKKVESFIHYLLYNFYSHGKTTYNIATDPISKSSTSNAVFTDFSIIRLPIDNGLIKTINIERRVEPYKISSSYYDYYRSAIVMRNKSNPSTLHSVQAPSKSVTLKEIKNNKISNEHVINNIVDIESKISSKGKSKLKKKVNKLIRTPKVFFIDAMRNIRKKSTSQIKKG